MTWSWSTFNMVWVTFYNCDSGEEELIRLSAIARVYPYGGGNGVSRCVIELDNGGKVVTKGTVAEFIDRLKSVAQG